MVRKLHLITQCSSIMAAGTTLSGLLHGRRHTPTPSLVPPRAPRATTCPWTTLALPEPDHPLRKRTYSTVLRATPQRSKIHICLIRRRPTKLHALMQWTPPHFRRLRQGTWRWQSLAHRLDLLLPLPPHISPILNPNSLFHFYDI